MGGGDEFSFLFDRRKASRRSVRGMAAVSYGSAKRCTTTTLSKCRQSRTSPSVTPLIFARRSVTLPLYSAPSSKKTNRGSICTVRCSSPPTPMSVDELLKSAPSHMLASSTTSVADECPPTMTTRSPLRIPRAFSAPARSPARCRSSRHVTWRTSRPPSRTSVTATLSSSLCRVPLSHGFDGSPRVQSMFSVMFSLTPSNHRGSESIGAASSTTRENDPS